MSDKGLNEIPTSNNLFSIYLDQIKALKDVDDFILSNHIDRHLAKRVNNTSRMTSKIVKHLYNDLASIGANAIDTALIKVATVNINEIIVATQDMMRSMINLFKVTKNVKLSAMLTLSPKMWRIKKFIGVAMSIVKYVGKVDTAKLSIGAKNAELLSGTIETIISIVKPINKLSSKSLSFICWKAWAVKRAIKKMVNIIEKTGGIKSLRFTIGLANLSLTGTAIRLALEPIHYLQKIKYMDMLKTGIKLKFFRKLLFGWRGKWDNNITEKDDEIDKRSYKGVFGLIYRASQVGKAEGNNILTWDFGKAFVNMTFATLFIAETMTIFKMFDKFSMMKIRKIGSKVSKIRALLFGGSYRRWFKKHDTIGIFTVIGEVANDKTPLGLSKGDKGVKFTESSLIGANAKLALALSFTLLTISLLRLISKSGGSVKAAAGNMSSMFTILLGGSYVKKKILFGLKSIKGKIEYGCGLFGLMTNVAEYKHSVAALKNMASIFGFVVAMQLVMLTISRFNLKWVWKTKIIIRRMSKVMFGTKDLTKVKDKHNINTGGLLPLMEWVGDFETLTILKATGNIMLMAVSIPAINLLMSSISILGTLSHKLMNRTMTAMNEMFFGRGEKQGRKFLGMTFGARSEQPGIANIFARLGEIKLKIIARAAANIILINGTIQGVKPLMFAISSLGAIAGSSANAVANIEAIINKTVNMLKSLVGRKDTGAEKIEKGAELLTLIGSSVSEALENLTAINEYAESLESSKDIYETLQDVTDSAKSVVLSLGGDKKVDKIEKGAEILGNLAESVQSSVKAFTVMGASFLLMKLAKKSSNSLKDVIIDLKDPIAALGKKHTDILHGCKILKILSKILPVFSLSMAVSMPMMEIGRLTADSLSRILGDPTVKFTSKKGKTRPSGITAAISSLGNRETTIKKGSKMLMLMSGAIALFAPVIGVATPFMVIGVFAAVALGTILDIITKPISKLGQKRKSQQVLKGCLVLSALSGTIFIASLSLSLSVGLFKDPKGIGKALLIFLGISLMLGGLVSLAALTSLLDKALGGSVIAGALILLTLAGTFAIMCASFLLIAITLDKISKLEFEPGKLMSIVLELIGVYFVMALAGSVGVIFLGNVLMMTIVINAMIRCIGSVARTLHEISNMTVPEYDENGKKIGETKLTPDEMYKAAIMCSTLISFFVRMVGDEPYEMELPDGSKVMIQGVGEAGLEQITNKTKRKFRQLKKIVGFVGSMAETLSDIASLSIPLYDPETGEKKGKRLMEESDFKSAALNSIAAVKFFVALMSDKKTSIKTSTSTITISGVSEQDLENISNKSKRKMRQLSKIVGHIGDMMDVVKGSADFKIPKIDQMTGKVVGVLDLGDEGVFEKAKDNLKKVLTFFMGLFDETNENCIIKDATLDNISWSVKNKIERLGVITSPIHDMIESIILASDMRIPVYDENGVIIEGKTREIDEGLIKKAEKNMSLIFDTYLNIASGYLGVGKDDGGSKPGILRRGLGIVSGVISNGIGKIEEKVGVSSDEEMSPFEVINLVIGSLDSMVESIKRVSEVSEDDTTNVVNILDLFEGMSTRAMSNPAGYVVLQKTYNTAESFMTKLSEIPGYKIRDASNLFKHLSEFSSSVSGNFDKLADIINSKLIDVLEDLKEALLDLDDTTDDLVNATKKSRRGGKQLSISNLTPKNNTTTGVQTPKTDVAKDTENSIGVGFTSLEDRLEEIIKLMKEANDQI